MTSTEPPSFRFHPDASAERRGGNRPHHLERFHELLGVEEAQVELARRLRYWVQAERAPVVGALHLTCSDEAEQECVDTFHRHFAAYLLPSLKLFSKSVFRTANLGSRYEWGAVREAEQHFSLAKGADAWKLLVVKVNAHVSVDDSGASPSFGRAPRFGSDSTCCGPLHAVLDGDGGPFVSELEEIFRFEEIDRVAALHDAVPAEQQGLFLAAVNARLQARRAMLDVQDHAPHTPTLYIIVPCVSLNRPGHDTELVLGIYVADRRGGEPHDEYCGLADRPEHYTFEARASGIALSDPHLHRPRLARDHRALVPRELERAGLALPDDPALARALADAEAARQSTSFPQAKAVLGAMLPLLAELAPAPAAAVLFGGGLIRIHQASRAHRLLIESERDAAARAMLGEVQQRIDRLSPEEARHAVTLLLNAYRP